MSDTLDRMVVQLIGDATSYASMIARSVLGIKQAANEIQSHGTRIEKSWSESMHSLAQSTISIISSYNIKGYLNNIFSEFSQHENIVTKFNATINMTGQDASKVVPELEQFAKSISSVSTMSKDNVLSMLAEVEAMGLYGDKAKQVIQNAQAMAFSQGGTAQGHIFEMAQLQQGELGRLPRKLGLVGMHNGPIAMAEAQKKLNVMWEASVQATEKTQGQIKQLTNEYQVLKQELGQIVSDAIKPIIKYTREAIVWFQGLSDQLKRTIVVIGLVASAFTFLSTAYRTISSIVGVMGTSIGILLLLIAGVGTAASMWIDSVGGIGNAWEIVEQKALRAWDYIRYYAQKFMDWVRPYWEKTVTWIVDKWEDIKVAAAIAWSFLSDAGLIAFNLVYYSISQLVENFDRIVASIKEVWDTSIGWVTSFLSENANLITGLIATSAAIFTVYRTIVILTWAWESLRLTQVISLAVWISWIAVVTIAKGVLLLYSAVYSSLIFLIAVFTGETIVSKAIMLLGVAVMLIVKGVVLLLSIAYGILTGSISFSTIAAGLWKAALWLVNIATLALTSSIFMLAVSIAALGIVAAVVTVGLLVVAFAALYAAVMGAIEGIKALGEGLVKIGNNNAGPLTYLTGLIGSWKSIIFEIIGAMRDDMPGAMKLISASFNVFIAELKALWPPLWEYLRDGFEKLWDYVSDTATIKMKKEFYKTLRTNAIEYLDIKTKKQIDEDYAPKEKEIKDRFNNAIKGMSFKAPLTLDTTGMSDTEFQEIQIQLRSLGKEQQELLSRYGDLVRVREEIKINKAIKTFRKIFFGEDLIPETSIQKAQKDAYEAGNLIGEKMFQGFKKSPKLDSALAGSAEGLARQIEWRERLAQSGYGKATIESSIAFKSPEKSAQEHSQEQLEVLRAIKDILSQQLKSKEVVRPIQIPGN